MSTPVDGTGAALPVTGGPMTMVLTIIGVAVTAAGFLARKVARV